MSSLGTYPSASASRAKVDAVLQAPGEYAEPLQHQAHMARHKHAAPADLPGALPTQSMHGSADGCEQSREPQPPQPSPPTSCSHPFLLRVSYMDPVLHVWAGRQC